MKNTVKSMILIAVAMTMVFIYSSCKKEESGKPSISYVRITDPQSSDSLLVAATQGANIAIIGENLQNAREIWFNDQRATISSTYISDKCIIVNVPSKIPGDITNKMTIYFENGESLQYDFKVTISKPLITGMDCEFVNAGDIAVLNGDYFYPPLKVYFNGGDTGTVVSVEDKVIKFKVPDNAQVGQITVTTRFGETKSDFWFRDNRNTVIDSDPYRGWHEASLVVSNPGPNDPPKISGNYFRLVKVLGAWSWNEVASGDASSMLPISKNIPDEAILKPKLYNLKFEVNTMKPYNAGGVKLVIGGIDGNQGDYSWNPPLDTKGKWKTIVIPYEDVAAAYKQMAVLPNGYFARVVIQGPGTLDCDMSFDNFRVVPKDITNE